MKVWVYVEGESDKLALQSLWESWGKQLREVGHGIRIIPLADKSKFFRKIGPRAAEKLYENGDDIVIGLPDLYPNQPYESTKYKHNDMKELELVQGREVDEALQRVFGVRKDKARKLLERFFPCALKYDLEMLLLSAKDELRSYLRTSDRIGDWRNPVEEQNHNRPPKRVVEDLFRTKSPLKHAYRDTKDASAILRNVTDLRKIIYDSKGQIKCPVFKSMLDWIGQKTTIPAYS